MLANSSRASGVQRTDFFSASCASLRSIFYDIGCSSQRNFLYHKIFLSFFKITLDFYFEMCIIVSCERNKRLMGYRQMVRQRTLTPSFQGSNPCTPVREQSGNWLFFFYLYRVVSVGHHSICHTVTRHIFAILLLTSSLPHPSTASPTIPA